MAKTNKVPTVTTVSEDGCIFFVAFESHSLEVLNYMGIC